MDLLKPSSLGFGLLLCSALACSNTSERSSGSQGAGGASSQVSSSSSAAGNGTGGTSGAGGKTASASGGSTEISSTAGASATTSGGSTGGAPANTGGHAGASSQGSGPTSSGGTGGEKSTNRTTAYGGAGGSAGSSLSDSGGRTTGGMVADAGIAGQGGSSRSGDAGTGTPDAGRDVGTGNSAFACNLVFGNTTTQQWFNGGFLTYPGIEASRWELIAVGHHYIGAWAQPNDSGWSTGFDGNHSCASNAQNPDRVIFIVTQSPPYSTAKQYQTDITAIVKNIKAKYSQVKRIELTTLIRSPGNSATACSSKSGNEQSIPAAEDEGLAAVAADPAFAGLVTVLPPFYVSACSDFNPDAPQYTDKGAINIAKIYGTYFAANP